MSCKDPIQDTISFLRFPEIRLYGFSRDLLGAGKDAACDRVLQAVALKIRGAKDFLRFGRGQIILRSPDGVLAAGTEPRADGFPAAW